MAEDYIFDNNILYTYEDKYAIAISGGILLDDENFLRYEDIDESKLVKIRRFPVLAGNSCKSRYRFYDAETGEIVEVSHMENIFYHDINGNDHNVWELKPNFNYRMECYVPSVTVTHDTHNAESYSVIYGCLPVSNEYGHKITAGYRLTLRSISDYPKVIPGDCLATIDDMMHDHYPKELWTIGDGYAITRNGKVYRMDDSFMLYNEILPIMAYKIDWLHEGYFSPNGGDIISGTLLRYINDDSQYKTIEYYGNGYIIQDTTTAKYEYTTEYMINNHFLIVGHISRMETDNCEHPNRQLTPTEKPIPVLCAGDNVTIDSYENLVAKYGTTPHGNLKTVTAFTESMKELCGHSGTVTRVDGKYIEVDFDNFVASRNYRLSTEFLTITKANNENSDDTYNITEIIGKLAELEDCRIMVVYNSSIRILRKIENTWVFTNTHSNMIRPMPLDHFEEGMDAEYGDINAIYLFTKNVPDMDNPIFERTNYLSKADKLVLTNKVS